MSGTSLVKNKSYEAVPGTPGTSDIPGVDVAQGTPEHYSTELVSVTSCLPTLCSNTPPITDNSATGSSLGSSGYNTPQPCSKAMVCHTSLQRVSVQHPATPGTPGTSGVPGTSGTVGELIEHLNEGWNSHSRSVDKLNIGEYLSYYVNEGVAGVLLSIGIDGKDNHKINNFTHSILAEPAGIIMFEDGVETDTVKISHTNSEIRLYRQPDNKIVCVVITGPETLVHEFINVAHDLASIPLNVYAHLYIADDTVEDASFETGKVSFGEA